MKISKNISNKKIISNKYLYIYLKNLFSKKLRKKIYTNLHQHIILNVRAKFMPSP